MPHPKNRCLPGMCSDTVKQGASLNPQGEIAMIDPIKVVAARIEYWSQINFPHAGACKLSDYYSNLKVGGFKDLQYGSSYPVSIDPAVIETAEFSNGSSVADKQTFSVNKTTTDTFSWSLKEGISTKVSGEVGLPLVAQGKVEVSVSFESTQTCTKTEARSWTYSSEVNVPAKKRIRTSFVVSEGKYRVPFTAKVPVRGKVWVLFANGFWWGGVEIDKMINDKAYNWDPATFDSVIEGTFDGVQGMDYQVRVEEFDLPSVRAFSAPKIPFTTQIIDSGVRLDGNRQSNLAGMLELSDKGPEQ
jgi:Clostridium epsilon toxin ETX/Bacillus mosquitocidal toxin MTX2